MKALKDASGQDQTLELWGFWRHVSKRKPPDLVDRDMMRVDFEEFTVEGYRLHAGSDMVAEIVMSHEGALVGEFADATW
jgi:hypothetical protein